jgi:hypothetical protein
VAPAPVPVVEPEPAPAPVDEAAPALEPVPAEVVVPGPRLSIEVPDDATLLRVLEALSGFPVRVVHDLTRD